MQTIIDMLLSENTAIRTVFLCLFIVAAYYLRKDSKDHKEEYQVIIRQMFDVVNKNTESNTKLSESIHHLKDKIK